MADKTPIPKTGPKPTRVPVGRGTRVPGPARRLPLVLGAVGLASLLLLALTMNAGVLKSSNMRGGDDESFRGQDGGGYSLQSVPGLDLGNTSLVEDAIVRLDAATAAATQGVLEAIGDGDAALGRAIGATAALPQIPPGHVAGTPPDLGIVAVPGFDIPRFPSYQPGGVGGVGGWAPDALPLLGRAGIVLPATGNPEVDAALLGLADALATLDAVGGGDLDSLADGALDGGLPTDGLGLPTDGLGLPTDGLGLPTDGLGLPTDGMLPTDGLGLDGGPSQILAGTSQSLNPDEDGAGQAHAHAQALVSSATQTLATADGAFDRVSSSQGQLVATIQAELARAQALLADGHSRLDLEAESRIRDALAQAQAAASSAQSQVDDYLGGVTAADSSARTALDDALAAQTTALQTLSAEIATDLQAEADAALATGASRQAEIDAALQQALDQLAATPDMDSVEAANMASTLQAQATSMAQQIAAEAQARAELLTSSSAALQESARGTIAALEDAAQLARTSWQDATNLANTDALAAGAYAEALALATGAARVDQLEAMLPRAHDLLDLRYANHVQAVTEAALGQNDAAAQLVESGRGLVTKVGLDADAAGTQDITYILAVAQQYADQMALDTEKREEYWAAIAAALDGDLDGVLIASGELLSRADAAAALVDQTRGQLNSLLAGP